LSSPTTIFAIIESHYTSRMGRQGCAAHCTDRADGRRGCPLRAQVGSTCLGCREVSPNAWRMCIREPSPERVDATARSLNGSAPTTSKAASSGGRAGGRERVSALGLAVPVNSTTRRILTELMATGRVRRAWLGVGGSTAALPPKLAERLTRRRACGCRRWCHAARLPAPGSASEMW
jgi:hypothetical protein